MLWYGNKAIHQGLPLLLCISVCVWCFIFSLIESHLFSGILAKTWCYSFAGTFNEKVTRTVRQFSPHLAAKMRPPLTWVCCLFFGSSFWYPDCLTSKTFSPVIRGRPSAKRAIYICGRPRWVFVFIFSVGNENFTSNKFLKLEGYTLLQECLLK